MVIQKGMQMQAAKVAKRRANEIIQEISQMTGKKPNALAEKVDQLVALVKNKSRSSLRFESEVFTR